jgi:hypothetical protein
MSKGKMSTESDPLNGLPFVVANKYGLARKLFYVYEMMYRGLFLLVFHLVVDKFTFSSDLKNCSKQQLPGLSFLRFIWIFQ